MAKNHKKTGKIHEQVIATVYIDIAIFLLGLKTKLKKKKGKLKTIIQKNCM